MTVTVDAALCIGCGACTRAAPGVFYTADRVSAVLPNPDESQYDRAASVALRCPVNAIRVTK